VFDGIRKPDNEDINYYYPTNDLVTAPEILFFWVARMIIAGYEYRGAKPFGNVYLTGIVRDMQRRKMSKSLGNSPDPLDLIAKYGADGVRVGMLLCSPAGNDVLFEESQTEQGRNFSNKIWNAFRLVKGWEVNADIEQPVSAKAAIEWFNHLLNKEIAQIDDDFDKYRISEALMAVYKLFWDEFSSWFLEMVKPAYQQPIDATTYAAVLEIFEKMLALLHPYMPFITEELWQLIRERAQGESLMVSPMPKAQAFDAQLIERFELMKETIAGVRTIRQEKNIPQKDKLKLFVSSAESLGENVESIIVKLAGLELLQYTTDKVDGAASFMVRSTEFFVPLEGFIDVEEEIAKLKTELEYTKGFLNSVAKKLSNERFVSGAPANVVDMERKKQADAEAKIQVIEERLAALSK
jgi:valyl-tRNA synthetase